jgi:hypothetical protein
MQQPTTNTGMEQGGATPAPIPQPAGSPSPNYVPPPIPSPAPAAPAMQDGGITGTSGGGIKAFFSDINWLEVALSSFIIAAMAYSIKYHKYMLMIEKSGYTNLNDRLQSLETKMTKKISELNATGSSKFRRRAAVRL